MYSKMIDKKWDETPTIKESDCLLIKGSQLMVVCNNVAVETICLLGGGGSIEVHYANQSIGISVVLKKKEKSKFKIRFADTPGKSGEDNCLEAINLLSKFVSVIKHPSHRGKKPAERVTKTMAQVMKDVLEGNPDILKTSELILPEKYIAELVQGCLLDPGFPALVAEIDVELHKCSGDGV